ncbi:hypothetical protein KGF54_002399 [Candida jiufengensis]|uniref:uncharacterized protein n=1 Tax=Candida jiufengensis TaxID=497108 RepID=UPI00222431E5|nr:uncharacterized protein KGF54_002399 [Candida jiufengensis]KAI5954623.1 hypothetical protein KGF54_002399 [Candida jiufengensis]
MSLKLEDPTSPKNSQFLNTNDNNNNHNQKIITSPSLLPSSAIRTNTQGSSASLSSLTERSSSSLSGNLTSRQSQQPRQLETAESLLQKQNKPNNNDDIIDETHVSLDLLDYKSLTLENKGSVARDHMANERTFLAWLRTSLSFITLGIGVTQLFRLEKPNTKVHTTNSIILLANDLKGDDLKKYGKPLGAIFIIIGILTLLFGFNRYFYVQKLLTKNFYPATRLGIMVLIFLIISVILVTLVHGSLARAGKVKSQTPKVEKQEKPKKPQGRAYMRLLYTRRFVNVTLTNGKRKMNAQSA